MRNATCGMILLLALPAQAQAPADGWVVWQSNRLDNQNEIYIGAADGTGVKRLTTTGAQRPSFAPDGRWISFRGFNTDEQATFVVRPDGSERKKIFDGPPLFWLHDNSGVVSEKQGGYYRVDPDSGTSTLLIRASDFTQVAGHTLLPGGVTHDGRWLLAGTDLYREGHSGDNGSFKASFAAVVLDLQHPDRVYFFGDGCWPFTPPAGERIYHICGDCPTKPDIYRMELTDLMTRASYAPEKAHPDADRGHEYNPDISNDNQWVAYMASTGCHAGYICDYEIFLHRLGAPVDQRVRVTNETHFDGYPSVHIGTPWSATKPWLTAVPSRLSFTKPAPQRVTLHNSGSGTLEPVSFTVQHAVAGQGWLTAKLMGGGNDQELDLTADPAGLGAGQHQATIEAQAANAASPPARIEVTLAVAGCPGGGPCITDLPVYAASEGCGIGPGALSGPVPRPLGGGASLECGALLLLLALLLAGQGLRRRPEPAGQDPAVDGSRSAVAGRCQNVAHRMPLLLVPLLALAACKSAPTPYEPKIMPRAYLVGANLRQAKLQQVNLYAADLRQADLFRADLRQAFLSRAILRNADLQEARMTRIDLSEADLQSAALVRATLGQAVLEGADLRRADLYLADLRQADLRDAVLHDARLRRARLGQADLRGASLAGADLRDADLRGARLEGADLRRARLEGAKLGQATLDKATLCEADRTSVKQSKGSPSWVDCTVPPPDEVSGTAAGAGPVAAAQPAKAPPPTTKR